MNSPKLERGSTSTSRPKTSQSKTPQSRQYSIPYSYNIDPRNVITRMLSGVDISLVDPNIYPMLVPLLENYLEKAENDKDTYLIREIQFYLRYIEYQPRREELARILCKPTPPPVVKIPALSPEQVKKEVDQILKTETLPVYNNQEEIDLVIQGLRERKLDYIAQGNYLKAETAEFLSRKLFSNGQLTTVENLQQDKASELKTKLKTARSDLEAAKKKWEELHENLKQNANAEFAELERIHNEQIQYLEDQFNEPPPPSIKKYSPGLLNLRRREQAMLNSKLYAQASALKEQADEVQRKEDQEQIERWHEHLTLKIKTTKAEQMKQLSGKKAFWKSEEQKLVQQGNLEIGQAERAIEHLTSNYKNTTEARKLTTVMKNQTRMKDKTPKKRQLPTLGTPRRNDDKVNYRQRQILNLNLYTMTGNRNDRKKVISKRPSTSIM